MKKSAALLACFALALSSCAAAPKDTSFKAQLDFENNYITLRSMNTTGVTRP